MVGKTGAARIAALTGCPVVPVGQWGAQRMLPPYTKLPRLFPRKQIIMQVGEPMRFTKLADLGEQATATDVAAATEELMGALTGLVATARHETPPLQRFDPRKNAGSRTGNPHRER